MPLHRDSFPIIDYIKNASQDLIAPLEDVGWEVWEVGNDPVDGQQLLLTSLTLVATRFACIDGDLSDDELDFVADLIMNINSDSSEDNSHHGYEYKRLVRQKTREFVMEGLETALQFEVPPAIIYLNHYDNQNGTLYSEKAKAMFFRFANAIVKADGKITKPEESALQQFKEVLYSGTDVQITEQNEQENNPTSQKEESKSLEDVLDELSSLVGLDRVKDDVKQLVNFLKVQQIRQSKGLEAQPISRHLVFYGNPGTGKTTVARLLAQVYHSLGIISRGHLVETDRSGLVAGYVGQTALKVRELVESALGGILFIDEAYSLNAGNGQDYGQEAIETLLKLMEDNRDDLIVVVAGYTDKMSSFLSSNPGLRSRFNKYFYFEDYSPAQLVDIFELFCQKAGYKLSQPTKDDLLKVFSVLYETRDETFGNARQARNLFEMTISNQANRIVALTDITEETLSTIEEVDIPGAADLHSVK